MELVLQRQTASQHSTQGELLFRGAHKCWTLELPVKDGMPGSAIPPGRFLVILAPSPKFRGSQDTWVRRFADSIPHLWGVPGRSNILIHWGNSPQDTNGCILVGLDKGENFVGSSRAAFSRLHPLLRAAQIAGETISIEVRGETPKHVPPALGPDLSSGI